MPVKTKNLLRIVIVTAVILLIPLVAMQFSDEVAWTLSDFIFAAVLLIGTGLIYGFVSSKVDNKWYKMAVGLAALTALALIWVNGAVGIIGDEGNAANLMYGGVLLVGLIGALIARLRPRGMAATLFAMAVAQMMVPVIALIVFMPDVASWGPPGVLGVFILNAFFTVLWIASAMLFRHSSAAS